MYKKTIHVTSANLDGDFYDDLKELSELFSIHESTIFKDLIEITEQHFKCNHVYNQLTEYQNHSPERWEKLHYSLDQSEIEKIGKARQKYKISISKLAFIGFLLFWELLIFIYKERLKKSIDINFLDSYQEKREKFKKHIPYFLNRFNILQTG